MSQNNSNYIWPKWATSLFLKQNKKELQLWFLNHHTHHEELHRYLFFFKKKKNQKKIKNKTKGFWFVLSPNETQIAWVGVKLISNSRTPLV